MELQYGVLTIKRQLDDFEEILSEVKRTNRKITAGVESAKKDRAADVLAGIDGLREGLNEVLRICGRSECEVPRETTAVSKKDSYWDMRSSISSNGSPLPTLQIVPAVSPPPPVSPALQVTPSCQRPTGSLTGSLTDRLDALVQELQSLIETELRQAILKSAPGVAVPMPSYTVTRAAASAQHRMEHLQAGLRDLLLAASKWEVQPSAATTASLAQKQVHELVTGLQALMTEATKQHGVEWVASDFKA
jgi:hypothetical protein